jgi:hypothetical protein
MQLKFEISKNYHLNLLPMLLHGPLNLVYYTLLLALLGDIMLVITQ